MHYVEISSSQQTVYQFRSIPVHQHDLKLMKTTHRKHQTRKSSKLIVRSLFSDSHWFHITPGKKLHILTLHCFSMHSIKLISFAAPVFGIATVPSGSVSGKMFLVHACSGSLVHKTSQKMKDLQTNQNDVPRTHRSGGIC